MKTLVTYQVTNDNSLSCLHKLNTSIVQTRLVNVLRTQKRLHNSTRTTLTQRQQAKPLEWIKTGYARCGIQVNPVSCFSFQMDITLDRTCPITLLESINYNMFCIDIFTLYANYTQ